MRKGRGGPGGAAGRAAVAALVVGAGALASAAATAQPTEAQRQKAEPCAACHGAEGRAPLADTPALAAQPKQFITTQLVMFREGNRKNVVMNALAAPLSNADINDLGSFFAAQAAPLPVGAPLYADAAAAGRALTEKLLCTQCHGAELKGQQHIPRLAGQRADYLKAQLLGFKAQTRFDMDGNMTAAAQALTPADIETLATYLGSLH